MNERFLPYDTAEYLDDDEAIATLAEVVMDEGEPSDLRLALDPIARAIGFTALARMAGLPREQLFEALRAQDAKADELFRLVLAEVRRARQPQAAE